MHLDERCSETVHVPSDEKCPQHPQAGVGLWRKPGCRMLEGRKEKPECAISEVIRLQGTMYLYSVNRYYM